MGTIAGLFAFVPEGIATRLQSADNERVGQNPTIDNLTRKKGLVERGLALHAFGSFLVSGVALVVAFDALLVSLVFQTGNHYNRTVVRVINGCLLP